MHILRIGKSHYHMHMVLEFPSELVSLFMKTDLLTKSGRSVLVQYVLTSMLIYLLLALDLPAGTLQAIDKIRRGFFMEGQKRCKGRALSNCMAQGHSTTWVRRSWNLWSPELGMGPAAKVDVAPKDWTWKTMGLFCCCYYFRSGEWQKHLFLDWQMAWWQEYTTILP